MTDAPPADSLAPDPAQALELVLAVTRGAWPATDEAVRDLFAGLGLRPVASAGDPVAEAETRQSPLVIHRLDVPFNGEAFATWSTHAGDFLGIDLQLYTSMHPNELLTRLGYDRILALLSHALGSPTDAWNDEEIPPRTWAVGSWQIVLHFFTLRHSGVMLSVDDAAIADRAERDAISRQAAHRGCS